MRGSDAISLDAPPGLLHTSSSCVGLCFALSLVLPPQLVSKAQVHNELRFLAAGRFRVLSRVTFAENVLPVDVDKFLQLCDLQNGFSGAAAAAAVLRARACVSAWLNHQPLFPPFCFLSRVSYGAGPAPGQPSCQRAPRSQLAPFREQQAAHGCS